MKTLYFDANKSELVILDQTRLPLTEEYISISTPRRLYDAIKNLEVRGAPAIGVAAALGLYACATRLEDKTPRGFRYGFEKTADLIASSRPTARNLFYAVERMKGALNSCDTVEEMLESLKKEAYKIEAEDIRLCRNIGINGEKLIKDGFTILTHCNAGMLATAGIGTALAPMYEAKARGKKIKVYADETRPLLQGARLTCFELIKNGIDTTLICDNMAASLMAKGKIDLVIVGCDRLAKNGDFANKIGTLSLAVNAKHFGVPFYVAVPSTTADISAETGEDIVIEERENREVTRLFFEKPSSPEGVRVYNPAFDVTPHNLVTGYITEKGIFTHIKGAAE